jgi:hypothetical protein
MSGVPRSQRLFDFAVTGPGFSPRWVCPANTVTLVKSLYVYARPGAEAQVTLIAQDAGFDVGAYLFHEVVALDTVARWDGWCVLNPDDSVIVSVETGVVDGWLSGAVLLGPPPFPPATRESPRVEPHR